VRKHRRRGEALDELLMDTTYLLPVFGVGLKLKNYERKFPEMLNKYSVSYNPVSVVEAKWIILRLLKKKPGKRETLLERFRKGLTALLNDERITQTALTNPDVEEMADKLLELGLNDYFDRMIYATATSHGGILLTEDRELHRLAEEENVPRPSKVLKWVDLASSL